MADLHFDMIIFRKDEAVAEVLDRFHAAVNFDFGQEQSVVSPNSVEELQHEIPSYKFREETATIKQSVDCFVHLVVGLRYPIFSLAILEPIMGSDRAPHVGVIYHKRSSAH